MPTVSDLIRQHLLQGRLYPARFSPEEAQKSHDEFFGPNGVFHEILAHASFRKLMGAFRYEQVEGDGLSYAEKARQGKAKTFIERAREKLELYEETGNQEFLVDVLNYCALEWHRPYHPRAHFESTERQEKTENENV